MKKSRIALIAALTLGLGGLGVGGAVAATDAMEDLITRATQREQQTGRRRRPFSSRAGFAPLI